MSTPRQTSIILGGAPTTPLPEHRRTGRRGYGCDQYRYGVKASPSLLCVLITNCFTEGTHMIRCAYLRIYLYVIGLHALLGSRAPADNSTFCASRHVLTSFMRATPPPRVRPSGNYHKEGCLILPPRAISIDVRQRARASTAELLDLSTPALLAPPSPSREVSCAVI